MVGFSQKHPDHRQPKPTAAGAMFLFLPFGEASRCFSEAEAEAPGGSLFVGDIGDELSYPVMWGLY